MDNPRPMPKSPHWRPLLRPCLAAFIGASAWLASSPAFAQTAPAAAPPGQKPPCVPAASYTLGYDCELFPLPGAAAAAAVPAPAAGAAPGAAAVVVAPVVGAVPAVVPATTPVAPQPPPPPEPPPPPPSSSSPSHAPAYVSFALGAAGAGAAVTFGILALQTKSTLSGECSSGNMCPQSASSTVSKLTLQEDLTDIGVGVAVVGVALGAILFATEHGSSSSTGTRRVQPWIGLGSGGVRGSF